MRKITLLILSLMLIVPTLNGCSKNSAEGASKPKTSSNKKGENNKNCAVFASAVKFDGYFDPTLYRAEPDMQILQFITEPMFKIKEDLTTVPHIAEWEESADHKTFTFKIKKGIKWHNGEELTVEDWKYAMEVIADPDYKGSRFSQIEFIHGAKDMKEGKAKTIAGLKVIDPYTLEIKLDQPHPALIDNLFAYPLPKKHYEGLTVAEIEDSPQVGKNPVGIGPFKIKKIRANEFVQLERFDDYWQGKPKLEGVVYKIIDGQAIPNYVKRGTIDFHRVSPGHYQKLKSMSNVHMELTDKLSYAFLGFKLGKRDEKKQINVMNNQKFEDKRLRQAIAYAIDRQSLIDAYCEGLHKVTNSPVPSGSQYYAGENELNPYKYDPAKAKQILDEAGYKDVDGDGWREDPKGKKLVINFDTVIVNELAEPRASSIIQSLREVGLNVKLNGGALKDIKVFAAELENDDPSMELFSIAWAFDSADLDLAGFLGAHAADNYTRWVNADSEKLLKEINSPESYDPAYRKQKLIEWQKLVNEELPIIILEGRRDAYALSTRLKDVKINSLNAVNDPHLWRIEG